MGANTKTNILLAVDLAPSEPTWLIAAAVDMARDLVRDRADHVVVLHVREFSVARLATMMREHGGADERRAVDEIVTRLRATGVSVSGLIHEADEGHVTRTILDAAGEFNARGPSPHASGGHTGRHRSSTGVSGPGDEIPHNRTAISPGLPDAEPAARVQHGAARPGALRPVAVLLRRPSARLDPAVPSTPTSTFGPLTLPITIPPQISCCQSTALPTRAIEQSVHLSPWQAGIPAPTVFTSVLSARVTSG